MQDIPTITYGLRLFNPVSDDTLLPEDGKFIALVILPTKTAMTIGIKVKTLQQLARSFYQRLPIFLNGGYDNYVRFRTMKPSVDNRRMVHISRQVHVITCIVFFVTGGLYAIELPRAPQNSQSPTPSQNLDAHLYVPQITALPPIDPQRSHRTASTNNAWSVQPLANNNYFLEAEYIHWKFRRSDLDFAISGNLNLGGGLDNAVRHEVQHTREPGFRMLFGKQIDDNWNIAFGLTSYDASQNASVTAGSGLVYATLTNPYQFDTQIGRADAKSDFDQNVFDLYLSRNFLVGGKPNVKIYGSLRFADHQSSKRVDYFDIDEITPLNSITTDTPSAGFGIRIGGEGVWHLSDTVFAFANGETSLLLNRVTATTVHTRIPGAGPDVVNSVADSNTQPLSVLGASVGIGRRTGNFEMRLGYEMTTWFNLGVRTAITNDVSASYYAYDRKESDILLEGLFLRCTWDF